jgi:hypothetical protein
MDYRKTRSRVSYQVQYAEWVGESDICAHQPSKPAAIAISAAGAALLFEAECDKGPALFAIDQGEVWITAFRLCM